MSFFTSTQGRAARKVELINKARVLSMCVQRPEFPYKYVTVEGTVLRTDQPPSAEPMFAVVSRYLPAEQAQGFVMADIERPGSQLVLFTIRPDRWLSADFSEDMG